MKTLSEVKEKAKSAFEKLPIDCQIDFNLYFLGYLQSVYEQSYEEFQEYKNEHEKK